MCGVLQTQCVCVCVCGVTAVGEEYRQSDGECVYLCGHSLGLMPKVVQSYTQRQLDSWATL